MSGTVTIAGHSYVVYGRAQADSYGSQLVTIAETEASEYPERCASVYEPLIVRADLLESTFSRHRFTASPAIAGVRVAGTWALGAWLTPTQDAELRAVVSEWANIQATPCALMESTTSSTMSVDPTPAADRSGTMVSEPYRPAVDKSGTMTVDPARPPVEEDPEENGTMTYGIDPHTVYRATTATMPMTTRTYVESNIQAMQKEDGAAVGDHTLPATDAETTDVPDDYGYDPFADATGDETPYEEDPPPPAAGLTTGAKALIGVAVLGGLFLVIRVMR